MGIFDRRPKDLVTTEAEVLFATLTPRAAKQTGKRNLEHEVKLAFVGADGGRREVTIETTVPWDRPLVAGSGVPVLISATRPDFVEIDFDGVKSLTEVGNAALDAARAGRPVTPEDLGFEAADEGK